MIDFWQSVFQNPWVSMVLLVFALASVAIILAFSVGQFHLFYLYLRYGLKKTPPAEPFKPGEHFEVVIQIPIYNEVFVAERVIDRCANQDYPKDRFRVQVLDDSDDTETGPLIAKAVDKARLSGTHIQVLRRPDRTGYKAGNLANGLMHDAAPFIAIIDADFAPEPDFLSRVMPRFRDESIGCVQTRPRHMNREFSWLTLAQALLHDAFYLVEQQARHAAGCFIRFNGTGGIWRRTALIEAGGWQHDTISEDMDLAYRAQLKGWRLFFDINVDVPAELPVSVNDVKIQQYRWAKGRAQVIRKTLNSLWNTNLSLRVKGHALLDMLNIFAVPAGLLLALASLWFIFSSSKPIPTALQTVFMLLQINVILLPLFTLAAMRHYGVGVIGTVKEWLRSFPAFFPLLLAMAPLATAALIDGLTGKTAVFHSTLKYNVNDLGAKWKTRRFATHGISRSTWAEGAMALYFVTGVWMGVSIGMIALVPFHSILFIGYGFVCIASILKT
jgi:cellulose synthase/poly-beta-1,6-N-acetylglucosamine synthase-like glycosyltransferase